VLVLLVVLILLRAGEPLDSRCWPIPVSLIGAFSAVLALGLLAPYDDPVRPGIGHRPRSGDAIVVVEAATEINASRKLSSRREATKAGDAGGIRARLVAIAFGADSVFVQGGFPRGLNGQF